MDALAREYAEEAHHLFIYTRETHPELAQDLFPAFKTFEEKMERARKFRDQEGSPRIFLVDDFEGTVHHQYGMAPNMSWVLDHTGLIHMRADWTQIADNREALESALALRQIKREEGRAFKPYYKETMAYSLGPDRSPDGRRATRERLGFIEPAKASADD